MRNFRHPLTVAARDLNGRARVVYSGRDPVECERYAGPAEKILLLTPDDLDRFLEERDKERRARRATTRRKTASSAKAGAR